SAAARYALRVVDVRATRREGRLCHDGVRHRLRTRYTFGRDSTAIADQHQSLLRINAQRVDAPDLVIDMDCAAAAGRESSKQSCEQTGGHTTTCASVTQGPLLRITQQTTPPSSVASGVVTIRSKTGPPARSQ